MKYTVSKEHDGVVIHRGRVFGPGANFPASELGMDGESLNSLIRDNVLVVEGNEKTKKNAVQKKPDSGELDLDPEEELPTETEGSGDEDSPEAEEETSALGGAKRK